MTSVNEHHEDTDPERLEAFLELPKQETHLGLGSYVYGLLTILLKGVAGTEINIREVHPDLGSVFAETIYTDLRAECLANLALSERPDILTHAQRRLPERLWPIIYGREAWGRDQQRDAEDVQSKLDVACCQAGIHVYRDLFATSFRAASDAIMFIIERTIERQIEDLREQWATEDARPRESACAALIEGEWSPLPPPEPLPSWSPLLLDSGIHESDELPASDFVLTPEPPAPPPSPPETKQPKPSRKGVGGANQKVVDCDLYTDVGRGMYRDYDSAPKGDKGEYPSADRITAKYNQVKPPELKEVTTATVMQRFSDEKRVWPPKWRTSSRARVFLQEKEIPKN